MQVHIIGFTLRGGNRSQHGQLFGRSVVTKTWWGICLEEDGRARRLQDAFLLLVPASSWLFGTMKGLL